MGKLHIALVWMKDTPHFGRLGFDPWNSQLSFIVSGATTKHISTSTDTSLLYIQRSSNPFYLFDYVHARLCVHIIMWLLLCYPTQNQPFHHVIWMSLTLESCNVPPNSCNIFPYLSSFPSITGTKQNPIKRSSSFPTLYNCLCKWTVFSRRWVSNSTPAHWIPSAPIDKTFKLTLYKQPPSFDLTLKYSVTPQPGWSGPSLSPPLHMICHTSSTVCYCTVVVWYLRLVAIDSLLIFPL